MKILGMVDVDRLSTKNEYSELFEPLSHQEYRDLRDDVAKVGVLDALKVMQEVDKYVVLAGHHRLKAALETNRSQVPCVLMETILEKTSALFDNLKRRQLTEEQRSAMLEKEEDYLTRMLRKSLIPQLYELYSAGKLKRTFVLAMADQVREFQEDALHSLVVEKEVRVEIPVYVEKINKLDMDLRTKDEELKKFREAIDSKELLIKAEAEKVTNAQRAVNELEDKLKNKHKEVNKEEKKKILDELDGLNKVIKNAEKETAELMAERNRFNKMVAEKSKAMEKLLDEIKSLKTVIEGKEESIAVFRQKVAMIDRKYNEEVLETRQPDFIGNQFTNLAQFIEALCGHVKRNKWGKNTLDLTRGSVQRVKRLLDEVVTEMELNVGSIDSVSVIQQYTEMENAVTDMISAHRLFVDEVAMAGAAKEEIEQLKQEAAIRIEEAKAKGEKDFKAIIDDLLKEAEQIRQRTIEKLKSRVSAQGEPVSGEPTKKAAAGGHILSFGK